MKKWILCAVFIPFARWSGRPPISSSTTLVEVRTGAWPILLERSIERFDTTFSLQFRDESVVNEVVMDTLPFTDIHQLRYFEKALSTLKTANNGDIAKFKEYSIKRADKKYDGVWYILRYQWGMTDFRQTEADIMISTIKGL
ncbi:MAG TPA: hypothetical protein VMI35_13025 [Puia sp.]|nr:hypothetical protein [Puia sp.]